MNRADIQTLIIEQFANLVPEEGTQWLTLKMPADNWNALADWLKHHKDLAFDRLFCLTAVDWKTHITMVYHLSSSIHPQHVLVLKADLERSQPAIETCCGIWRTAEFHEREVFEMFGVYFLNHPDLRNLILPDDWTVHPMLKDYDDPVNMIRL